MGSAATGTRTVKDMPDCHQVSPACPDAPPPRPDCAAAICGSVPQEGRVSRASRGSP